MQLLRLPRKSAKDPLNEIEHERQRLEREEREYQRMIREEPKRIAREQAERASTLPPPDDFKDRQREHRFYAALMTRGQLRNERRSQTASFLLFVLLVTSTIALAMWMLRIAQI